MKIRQLKKQEIEEAVRINRENLPEYDYDDSIRKELEAMFDSAVRTPEFFAIEDNGGKMIAFGGYAQSWMSYEVYDMIWINVDPEHQRKGHGTKLVEKIIQTIKEKNAAMIMLYCRDPEFYERFGFTLLSPLPDDYCVMGLRVR